MVEFERRGRVAIMTIRRPEARNAVNQAVAVPGLDISSIAIGVRHNF